jgi:predicted porin
MKKVLIAALVSALPAVAMAEVVVYGTIKGGVENVDSGSVNNTNIADLGSRIGFKGAEDLGNGLKAIWQVETGVAIDNSNNSSNWASRQSFIGLSSDYGTFRLGNLSNFGDSYLGSHDFWEYDNQALGLGVFTRDNTRVKNAVRYDMPEIAGVNAMFLYGTKESKTVEVANNEGGFKDKQVGTDRETYNLGLSYEYANFFGKYGYTREAAVEGENRANNKNQIEVGYNANNLFVGLAYQNFQGDSSVLAAREIDNATITAAQIVAIGDASKKFESSEYALSAAYTMGAITPKITFAQGEDFKYDGVKQANTGYKQFIVGADYALSKRTIVGAQYGQMKYDGKLENGDDTVDAFGVNMIHKF